MKKILARLFGALIIAVALLLTPTAPLITTGVRAFATTDEAITYTAPKQDALAFKQSTTTYNLSNWQQNTNEYLIATTVTRETNDIYHNNETYKTITLSGEDIGDRQPYMLLAKNAKTSGSLTTSEITFAANGYYTVAVEYQIKGDKEDQSFFYLGDNYLPLQPQGTWRTAMFLVQTDRLTATTLPARLFLGNPQKDVYGAAYYNNFTVTALTATEFNNKKEQLNKIDQMFLDFTNDTDVELVKTVANTAFTAPSSTQQNVIATNNIYNEDVPTRLNFADERKYFHTQNGKGNVMLMAAHGNNTNLTLDDYTFQPLPHEVYMFQFYSIMPEDFSQFYFCIGDTYQSIAAVSYPTYNGWQLNTVFFVAGHDAVQEFTLSFTLGAENETAVTGWAALDDLRIYRVSGDYATTNVNALGVQGTKDNNSASNWTIANGSFELGTATGLPTDKTYPYPLKADSWTTEADTNGIVNTAFWKFDTLDSPGIISERYNNENNNIYMLRNTSATENEVTSPVLNTTVGGTIYLSFDAYATDAAPLYVSFQTTEGVELNRFTINDNGWQHYELAITEHNNAVTRSYQLVFSIKNIGAAYLDNFRSESTPYQFDSAETTNTQTIDLTSPVDIVGLWQVTDSTLKDNLATAIDRDGITLRNEDQATVAVQYGFGYNLTVDEYYRVSVTARGKNAFVELSGFDGYFTVTADDTDADAMTTYNFYYQAAETTTLNLLITLGSKEANTYCDGYIYVTELTFTSITDAEYNLAVKNLGENDKVVKVSEATEEPTDTADESDPNNFFGENWWYLIPTLITAIAIVLAVASFLWRRLKFNNHVTAKNTTYARDMQIKNTHKKIVAQKSAKVDNIKDETPHNN